MKRIVTLLTALICSFQLLAQQDALVSQYMFTGLVLNPAYAGSHDVNNVTLLARKQWVGFQGAPLNQVITCDGKMSNENVGLGVIVFNDKIGVSNYSGVYANYAYHIGLNDQLKLSFGLRGGASYYFAKLTELTYWDQDAVFQEDIRGTVMPNIGTGAYLYSDRFYLGISVPNLLNYDPATTLHLNFKNVPKLIRHYYTTAGFVVDLSDNLLLKPSVLVRFAPNTPLGIDLNANLLINNLIWVGASYRVNNAIVGIAEFMVNPQFRVGYSYDYSTNMLQNYSGGSHELILSYDFGKKTYKMKSPRFF